MGVWESSGGVGMSWLVLRTPRLELRPDDDAGLMEPVAAARDGVHDPAMMPFQVPWTDVPAAELGRGMVQFLVAAG